MNMCDKEHVITVTELGPGNYEVQVETECPNVKEYMRGFRRLGLDDLTDKTNSRIFDRMRVAKMSATCLVPSGILSAGWMEAGLWAKSRALGKERNEIEFIE